MMSFPFEPIVIKFPVLEVPAAMRTEKHVGACPVCPFLVSAQTLQHVGDALGEHFVYAHQQDKSCAAAEDSAG